MRVSNFHKVDHAVNVDGRNDAPFLASVVSSAVKSNAEASMVPRNRKSWSRKSRVNAEAFAKRRVRGGNGIRARSKCACNGSLEEIEENHRVGDVSR